MDIPAFILLLAASAFFSGAETAFFSLDVLHPGQVEKLHIPASAKVRKLLSDPYRLLITLLVGNTLVNIAASAVFTEFLFKNLGERGIVISLISLPVILLIFGEVTPKMFALSYREKITGLSVIPVRLAEIVFAPLRIILTNIAKYILARAGITTDMDKPTITEKEIRAVLSLGRKQGVVNRKEREMIEGIFEFKELNAADIMTPRINIVALDITDEKNLLVQKIKESQYSRFPVFVHTLDNIVGIIHAKDFLLSPDREIREIIKDPFFAPENMKIDDLLAGLQKEHMHMAVITDEYGVTSGIVTMEDILEEIVGEIRDEFDFESPEIRRVDKNTYKVDGRTHIDKVNEKIGTKIKTDEVDTIGGFVIMRVGKIPQAGDKVKAGKFVFIVDDVSKNRVTKVTIEKLKGIRRIR